MVFVDDKPADRVIGLAVNRVVSPASAVMRMLFSLQRQVVHMEIHAMVNREFHFVFAVCQQQATVGVYVLDKARDRININGIRQVSARP